MQNTKDEGRSATFVVKVRFGSVAVIENIAKAAFRAAAFGVSLSSANNPIQPLAWGLFNE
jgi:hypothetical protein